LAWMPPEAFKGDFSEMSDMFSFAVLMSEVLSLKLQHAGKSTSEITEFARGKFKVSKAIQNRAFQLPNMAEGSWKKCEEARHSPPQRAVEDALVTSQHDVPRWARGL
jgi:hypothetical protein